MIRDIYLDPDAFSIASQTLAESGIEVEIGNSLLIADDLDHEKIIILKPDEWYNTSRMKNPPKSADGLVFVQNGDDYHMYVVELKSSRFPDLNKKHIQEKFDTVFELFLARDFSRIFDNPSRPYTLRVLKLWLVCDPMGLRNKATNREDFMRLVAASKAKMRTQMADYALSFKPIAFKGKAVQILPMLSPPLIEVDHYVDHLE